jgi:DNA replication protein DnaC
MPTMENRPASLSEIPYLSRAMKAGVIAEVYENLAEIARNNAWSYEEYLAAVMDRQVSANVAKSIKMKIKAAKFTHQLPLRTRQRDRHQQP